MAAKRNWSWWLESLMASAHTRGVFIVLFTSKPAMGHEDPVYFIFLLAVESSGGPSHGQVMKALRSC